MRKPKSYRVTPAQGQALLSFEGRKFPEKIEVFEAEVIEKVQSKKAKKQSLLDKETDLNADFRNLLIQGDCLSACAYLKSKNIKVDLIYIDPPFASGANYAKKIYLRNGGKSQVEAGSNTIGEEVMYEDIWQKEDYLNWLYERLLAIKDVMTETASVYVHLDWHIGHYVKVLMDEIFGEENFRNEVIWCYRGGGNSKSEYKRKHDTILFYSASENNIFNWKDVAIPYEKLPLTGSWRENTREEAEKKAKKKMEEGMVPYDWWVDIPAFATATRSPERVDYPTQKPDQLLERIIKASSDEGMIVADFFSGSGVTAKAANDFNRKWIACDVGVNALQVARDSLKKSGADFDVLKVKDGLRLFRNPAQTTAKIFGLIDGFKSRADLDLSNFWDGGIAQAKGAYIPVKFSGIHDKLTKELLDVYLEETYKLEDTSSGTSEVVIIYAHKDMVIDQNYLNKRLKKTAKTELPVKLVSLDSLLGEKGDALFTPDEADIKITKQGKKYKVEIKKFYSPYLRNKIAEFNAKKGTKVKISNNGLEMIEAVQFDTTLQKAWKSDSALEDKAGIKDKIKGVYTLTTKKFKMKIRNIAGDEIIIDSKEINTP